MSAAVSTMPRSDDAEIPILDLAPYLSGQPGAREKLGKRLCHALENIGFYFIKGHGVPQSLVDAVFAETERFHAQPLDRKMRLRRNRDNVGYLPMSRSSDPVAAIKPNVNEAFFLKRDLPADHPDVLAHKRFRGTNLWPDDLPGFRETVVAYCDALEALAKKLVPLYAVALDLPADYFDKAFAEPQYTLRMTHYPFVEALGKDEFGIAPHSDTSFLTLLAQNKVPGLSLRTRDGRWIDAPAQDGHFLVNGGDMLRRWTNDRLLATPHRASNRSGRERYAIPFFVDCGIDWPIECLPTCMSATRPRRRSRRRGRHFRTHAQRCAAAGRRARTTECHMAARRRAGVRVRARRLRCRDLAYGGDVFRRPGGRLPHIGGALEPAGRLVFACWGPLAENRHWLISYEIALRHSGPLARRPADAPGTLAFADPEYVGGVLAAAGFAEITVERAHLTIIGGSPEEEVRQALAMGPTARLIEEKQPDQAIRQTTTREIEAAFAAEASSGPIRLSATMFLVAARRPV